MKSLYNITAAQMRLNDAREAAGGLSLINI